MIKNNDAYVEKMTKTPLARLIISLGIPTTVSMLVTNIYNMADTYFVGTLGESAQGATGVLFTLQAIIQAVAFMLGQGSGTSVSKALANKNKEEADRMVSTGFFTGLFSGTVITVLGLIFLVPFMKLLGSSDTILPYACRYGICVLASCPIVICSFILNNNLRYEGKALYAMVGIVSGGLINIFGDYLLVVVFPMGILGAGIATVASQIISFIILLVMFKRKAQSSISFKYISKSFKDYFTICRIGFPAMIRQGLSSISGGILNNLTKPYGDAAIAAMSIVNRFTGFIVCVGLGIGQGFQPVAASNYAAKKFSRVKKGLLITMLIGTVFIMCLAIPTVIFSEDIVLMFQKSEKVVEIGSLALRYAAIGSVFLAVSVPVNMLYQSIQKAGLSSFLSLLRSGLMLIPVLILSTSFFGLTGIQISQPIADVLTCFISIPFIISFLVKKEEKMI